MVARDDLAYPVLIQKFQLIIAIAFPEFLLGFQMTHLLTGDRSEDPAVFEIALNLIRGDAITNNFAAFKCHLT